MLKSSVTVLFLYWQIFAVYSSKYQQKPSPTVSDFRLWMSEHEKSYDRTSFDSKFETFSHNHRLVETLNEFYHGQTEFKLNMFADMSPLEFKTKILMRSKKNVLNNQIFEPIGNPSLPESFDWREKGAVTPVKDQGSVGTCWAFSAVQNLEGQYRLKGNPLTNLSVEQIVDCDGSFNATSGQGDCGVFGGWPFLAFDFIKRVGGIAAENDYPYCVGQKKSCFPCPAAGYNKTFCGPPVPYCKLSDSCQAKLDPTKFVPKLRVVGWKQTSLNEEDIAAQLMGIGPLSVALNAEKIQFYHKGVFDPISCDPADLDHAVLMVGWGIDGKKPYWIIKNSWGPKWGESGYFRILRGKGKCGVNTQVTSAILA